MVDFAGFSMPLQYTNMSIGDSTKHTRLGVSVFDVSHMLQTEIKGKDSVRFLESLTTADIVEMPENTGTLSVFTNEKGGIRDDLILSKLTGESIYMVTNAGCINKDLPYLQENAEKWRKSGKDVTVEVLKRGLVAVQGPELVNLLRSETNVDLDKLYFMHTIVGKVFGVDGCRITRCGYTGEDGVEISVDESSAEILVERMLASSSASVALAGLGARDALRLEAGLCLYGNDINEDTTPVEAAISFVVAKRRRTTLGFPGAERIVDQLEKKNYPKKRIGLVSTTGRAPRGHLPIVDPMDRMALGFITSGCRSPCLDKNIGMGYMDTQDAKVGREVDIDFGSKVERLTVTKMPFVPTKYYMPPKKK